MPTTITGDSIVGYGEATNDTLTEIVAAPGAGKYMYITMIVASNTSGTADVIDLYYGDAKVQSAYPVPGGSTGHVISLVHPLKLPMNTAFKFKALVGQNKITVNAAGFVRTSF